MKIICWSVVILYSYQQSVEGEYVVTKVVASTGGRLKHISTLILNKDKTFVYTDTSFSKEDIVSGDTVSGTWYVVNDTLITKNYDVKWLIRKTHW